MGVPHAGDNFKKTRHHILVVDLNEPLDPNEPIPQDKTHLHFGAGQTEARIELPPGKHTLQLVLGDANHYPFNPLFEGGFRVPAMIRWPGKVPAGKGEEGLNSRARLFSSLLSVAGRPHKLLGVDESAR